MKYIRPSLLIVFVPVGIATGSSAVVGLSCIVFEISEIFVKKRQFSCPLRFKLHDYLEYL